MAKEILIVEDDRNLARSCARALESEGYEVRLVHDGLAALEQIVRTPPALIVLDLLIPKRDGRAVLEELTRSQTASNIPVIAISGIFKGKSTERELEEAGAKGFLEKPFEVEDLVAEVQALVGSPVEQSPGVDWSRARLEDVSAAEFLWRVMQGGSSGAVHFQRGKLHKILLLDRGKPVSIRSNAAAETLGRFLLARNQIDEAAYKALIKAGQQGQRQGDALIQMKLLTPEQVDAAVQAQSAAKVLELFAWTSGEAWLQDNVRKLSYGSPLEGWTPMRLVLRGVKYVPFERLMAILTPFAAFSVELTGETLHPKDQQIPAAKALLQVLQAPTQVGQLLSDHAAMLYGLWLVGLANFRIPGIGDDPTTSPSLRSIPIPDSGQAGQLQETLHQMRAQSYFDVLGLASNADAKAIQSAYLQLAKRYHPDRYAAESVAVKTVVSEIFNLISTARTTLSDPTRRAEYQRELEGNAVGPARVHQVLEAEKLCREGEALLKKREYAQALTKFEEACKLDPEEGEFHALLGWAYFVVHRETGGGERIGIEKLERSVALAPESTKGYYYLAQLHKACGRPEQAQRFLRKVLDLDPSHVEAGQALRVLRMRASKEDKKGSGGLFGFGRKKT